MDNKTKQTAMLTRMKIVRNFVNDRQGYLNTLEYYSAEIEVVFGDSYDESLIARAKVYSKSFEDEVSNYKTFGIKAETFEDDVAALDDHIKSLPSLKSAKQAILMRQLEAVRESSDDLGLNFSEAITEIMESLSSNILEAPKGDVA
jgi:hypothetical protein